MRSTYRGYMETNHKKAKLPNNGKVLFVANHNMLGIEAAPLAFAIYLKTGQFPRALVEHLVTKIPFFSYLVYTLGGCVPGTPSNAERLMEAGYPMLVFPGGGHEVFRKKSHEKYYLFWKKRTGFARIAIKHGYTIIPVSIIGTEDCFRILADIPIPDTVFRLIGDTRRNMSAPLAVPTSYQMYYIKFGRPIPTAVDPSASSSSTTTSSSTETDSTTTTPTTLTRRFSPTPPGPPAPTAPGGPPAGPPPRRGGGGAAASLRMNEFLEAIEH
ncbi:hypothetical protein HK102_012082 [Quaeritorhiza haematococci]|nr:hypothetical protein HK102_012082 [Quaeritorhiza haematococci]